MEDISPEEFIRTSIEKYSAWERNGVSFLEWEKAKQNIDDDMVSKILWFSEEYNCSASIAYIVMGRFLQFFADFE